MRQSKTESMIDTPRKRSPTPSAPRACSTAMRAEQPVPVGLRSILPGGSLLRCGRSHTVDGLDRRRDLADEMCRQSGFSGWAKPSCSLAARVMRMPASTMSPRFVRAQREAAAHPSPQSRSCRRRKPCPPRACPAPPPRVRPEPGCERRHVVHAHGVHAAVAAGSLNPDEAAGASRTITVSGSVMGRMPVSSSTVATQRRSTPTSAACPRAP